MIYCSWDMARDRYNYFSFWAIFCTFTSLTAWKMKISKKKMQKNPPRDIIILHNSNKNHDHMIYFSWDMARDGCNYFSFWAFFCLLPNPKNVNFKKWKKAWRYHFTQVYQKSWSYAILFLRYGTWHVITFHFGLFFVLLPPNSPKNQNFQKTEENPGEIVILHRFTKNYD